MAAQLKHLKNAISAVEKYMLAEVTAAQERIKAMAVEMQEKEKVPTPVMKTIPIREEYTYYETVQKQRQVTKFKSVNRQVRRIGYNKVDYGHDVRVFGIKVDHKSCYVDVPYEYYATVTDQIPYTEMESYVDKEVRKGTRDATKQIEKTELVEKYPLAHYIAEARKQIALEVMI